MLNYVSIPNLAINPAPFRHGVNLTERPQNIQEKVRDKSENDQIWFSFFPKNPHKNIKIIFDESSFHQFFPKIRLVP